MWGSLLLLPPSLSRGVMVAQRTLNPLILVRIQARHLRTARSKMLLIALSAGWGQTCVTKPPVLRDRLMVGLTTLNRPIVVRVHVSQPLGMKLVFDR